MMRDHSPGRAGLAGRGGLAAGILGQQVVASVEPVVQSEVASV